MATGTTANGTPQAAQTNRPMKVTTPLGPDALLLVRLAGHEAISRPFNFRLELIATNGKPIAFHKLLGQAIKVELAVPGTAQPRYYHGICQRVSQVKQAGNSRSTGWKWCHAFGF